MRQAKNGQDVTFEAKINLSTYQYTAVKYTTLVTGGQAAAITTVGAGERAHGILQNKPDTAGKAAVMRVSGFSKMKVDGTAGGGIVAGTALEIDASGRGVPAANDKDHVLAFACEPSSAAGDIIEVQIAPFDLAV
jgi:hypothetical protein